MLICALIASAVCVSCVGLQNGATALHFASGRGHQGVVEVLAAKGAEVEAKANVSSSCIPVPL
jgi:ankyrin repeat protein